MKKIMIALVLWSSLSAFAWSLPWQVQLEGVPLSFEVEPQITNGQILVPLREFYQALGLDISFNHATQYVVGESQGLRVETRIGSPVGEINGNPLTMATPPVIVKNRTMVPLGFIADTFGYQSILSPDLRVIYLRKFIIPFRDKADFHSREAIGNRITEVPPAALTLRTLSGKKEHYLGMGASWNEELYFSTRVPESLQEDLTEPARFSDSGPLYLNFILENPSEQDITTPFLVRIHVKMREVQVFEIPGIAAGGAYPLLGVPISGLTLGNNLVEVFVDREKTLALQERPVDNYRIIYAYSTR